MPFDLMAVENNLPESSYPRVLNLLQQASVALKYMDVQSLDPVDQQHVFDLVNKLRTRCSEAIIAISPAQEAGVVPEFMDSEAEGPAVA
jgi:hypothetical protein